MDVVIQVLGTAISFAMAAASFAIPHFLDRYSKVWDYRLEQTLRAEKKLGKQLGED